jgi:Immunity protein 35
VLPLTVTNLRSQKNSSVSRELAMELAERWIADCSEPCSITRFELREDGCWFFEHQPVFTPDPHPAMERDGWGVAIVNPEGYVEPLVGRLSFHRRIQVFEKSLPAHLASPASGISVEHARDLAIHHLHTACFFEPSSILENCLVTKPYGWIFYFQSTRYLNTQNKRFKLIKNAPFLVSKASGQIVLFGSVGYKDLGLPVTADARRKIKDLTTLAHSDLIPGQEPLAEEQTRSLAQAYLDARFIEYDAKTHSFGCTMSLLPELTEAKANGWSYRYANKQQVEAKDPKKPPVVRGPVFILKNDGAVFEMSYRAHSPHSADA